MTRLTTITPQIVVFMPDVLHEGILYISWEFDTAIHLCACGCGLKTVTPMGPRGWDVRCNTAGQATITPSIGNFQFPCKSHYNIKQNEVQWL